MATYYNRLHNAGEVDFAKHGCKGDGTISDLAKFEDAFAVALDRGLNCLVSPAGEPTTCPTNSVHLPTRSLTVLAQPS
jgi:hypothetical protein